jgi:hypothetical protein
MHRRAGEAVWWWLLSLKQLVTARLACWLDGECRLEERIVSIHVNNIYGRSFFTQERCLNAMGKRDGGRRGLLSLVVSIITN